MDCRTYTEPIKDLIDEANKSNNSEKICEIDEKLDDLLHLRTNSSRKGRLSRKFMYKSINDKLRHHGSLMMLLR